MIAVESTDTWREDMARKYIVCPDSYKGSLSAADAARAIRRGILSADPDAVVIETPIADGGEGTLDALVRREHRISCNVVGTSGARVTAEYGDVNGTAVIEMASAAGITLVPADERNPEHATTYGVGELILDALDRGYRSLLLTVGGSGTNDGGSGMMEALGVEFYDDEGKKLSVFDENKSGCENFVSKIAKIDLSRLDGRLKETTIVFACDVKNPMVGATGATYVYGPQKGADEAMLARLETGMMRYALLLRELSGVDIANYPGCGAGGGLAAPLVALFNARIVSGIDAVLSSVDFDGVLDGASLVITGEGKIDGQSAYGKAISGVATRAKAKGVPVLALVGMADEGAEKLHPVGVTRIAAMVDIAPSPSYSMTHAGELLEILAKKEVEIINL